MGGELSPEAVRALIDRDPGDPVAEALEHLLSGLGYDFAHAANVARANDQIVRSRAAALVAEAEKSLLGLEQAYREAHVPPATSSQPFPPPDAMRGLRVLGAARRRLFDLEATLHTLEAPASDRIWARLRSERALLEKLFAADVGALKLAVELAGAAAGVAPAVGLEGLAAIEQKVAALQAAFKQRQELLFS